MYTKEEISLIALNDLVDKRVSSLPVTLQQDGVIIRSIQFLSEFWKDSTQSYIDLWGEHGILAFDPYKELCVIFINDDEPIEIQRWHIAVGFALIQLGALEEVDSPTYFRLGRIDCMLSAFAEEFTYSFICPDVILDICDIKTPQEIIKYCKIPFGKAHYKAKKMKQFNYNNLEYANLRESFESDISLNFEAFLKQFEKE